MSNLSMTDDEIRTKFKNGTPISILADLNACKADIIKEIVNPTVTAELVPIAKKKLGRPKKNSMPTNSKGHAETKEAVKEDVEEVGMEEPKWEWAEEPVSIEEKEMFFADVAWQTKNEYAGQGIEPDIEHLKSGAPYELPEMKKPPLGLEPRRIWESRRVDAVCAAISRYVADRKPIPKEWIEEYNEVSK